MANLYLKKSWILQTENVFQAAPGAWQLRLREGRSKDIYKVR